jgi:hypothetical protein
MGGQVKGLTELPRHSLQPAEGGEAPIQPEASERAAELPKPSAPSASTASQRRQMGKRGGMGSAKWAHSVEVHVQLEHENRLGFMGPRWELEAHFRTGKVSRRPLNWTGP